ncbi:MAG: metallophosphoesterase [Candidatus Pacebacteria bacterium]|nr:metallophosphoesterase [Candidatus Paceibacterota bacterium]
MYLTYILLSLLFISIVTFGFALMFFVVRTTQNKKITKKDFLISLVWGIFYITVMFLAMEFYYPATRVLFYYLGFLHFSVLVSAMYWILYGIARIFSHQHLLRKKWIGYFCIFASLFISFYAAYNFHAEIKIENIEISSDKVSREYNILQVSDIQHGTVSKDYIKEVVDLINKQDVDFVVFTGDLVDFDNYKEEDLLVLNDIKVPMYFERGNHELYHFPERILSYLQKIGSVRLLLNQKESFDEIDIVGIDYQTQKSKYTSLINNVEIDNERFSILLYHEPKHIEYSAELGYDLLLYGHTHGGQIWPYTELVDFMYKYGDGYFQVGKSHVYTSDGAALWGPRMRLGSQNEMVIFTIKPE